MKKVLIFDGTNTFLRNFVVNPTADVNGNPIGGLAGTLRSVKYMIRETGADRVIFVWDGIGGAQRRRGVLADYKMGRRPRLNREVDESQKSSSDNMQFQKAKLKTFLTYLGVTQIEIENIEADDTIGYLVGLLEPTPKVVVSSDRDMWQFVSDTTVVYWPTKKVYITKETFNQYSPILTENFVLSRALGNGDSSDNIKGIKGLGEKTLLKIIPGLSVRPYTIDELFAMLRHSLTLDDTTTLQKKWFQVILENEELVRTNLSIMQLVDPEISPQAASIIRNAANMKPSFNVTGFKLALLNNNIQLVENDMFTTFQEFKLRAERA